MAVASTKISSDILSLLKIDNRGWDIELFEDNIKITTCLCNNCNYVCCDAVELGCDHDDDDIYLYCNQCLKYLINNNNNKCPIDHHSKPIIIPNRATRRQISKSIVNCPFSIKYKQKQYNQENDNAHIIDTMGGDEKEGIAPANNKNKKNDNIKGCEWNGTLNNLLNGGHLSECIKKYNPSLTQTITIKKLNKIIDQQKQKINEQEIIINNLQQQNDDNLKEINKFKQNYLNSNKIIDEQSDIIKKLEKERQKQTKSKSKKNDKKKNKRRILNDSDDEKNDESVYTQKEKQQSMKLLNNLIKSVNWMKNDISFIKACWEDAESDDDDDGDGKIKQMRKKMREMDRKMREMEKMNDAKSGISSFKTAEKMMDSQVLTQIQKDIKIMKNDISYIKVCWEDAESVPSDGGY